MPSESGIKRVVVIGIGNALLKDEGVGVHVIQRLENFIPPEGIQLEVVDGGTSPDICLCFEGVDKLIAIDAAKGNNKPGTIYRFHPDELEYDVGTAISMHQAGLLHSLKLLQYLGLSPKQVVIIGIEPKEIDWGLELSDEVAQRVPEVVKFVQEEIQQVLLPD